MIKLSSILLRLRFHPFRRHLWRPMAVWQGRQCLDGRACWRCGVWEVRP